MNHFDIALVCRWFNGQKAITPKISRYYQEHQMEDILISDIRENVVPLFYDASMCAEKIYDLLMLDDTISGTMRAHISEQFPCSDPEGIARLFDRPISTADLLFWMADMEHDLTDYEQRIVRISAEKERANAEQYNDMTLLCLKYLSLPVLPG